MILDALSFSLTSLFELSLNLGEILTSTWGGRVILGMAFASLLARFTRP